MAAWLVTISYSESDEPSLGSFPLKMVVSADTFEDAVAAIRAHKFTCCGQIDDILSVKRIADEVIDVVGDTVRSLGKLKVPAGRTA